MNETRALQGLVQELPDRPGAESGVAPWVPADLWPAPVLPEPDDLRARVHDTVSEAAVDEAPLVWHAGCERQWRHHVSEAPGERDGPPSCVTGAEPAVPGIDVD